ncbi:response regulator [Microcoleus vaginatus]|uniref:response regulator n=1 Tax=Microcoleus vaginatus TaxID=119532 RepID=UPI001F601CBC|nr:response regulator [Microcoleus vaginatus HSN003]
MHPHLQRQLEQLGLASESPPPTAEQWQLLLEKVSYSYEETRSQHEPLLQAGLRAEPIALQDLASSPQSHQDSPTASEVDRLRASVNSLGTRLCILDAKGFVISVNPEAERLLGWRESELAGVSLLERIGKQKKGKKSQVLTAPKHSLSKSEDATIAPTLGLQEARSSSQPCNKWDEEFLCRGEQALRLAKQLRPDAITLDVILPGMDCGAVLSALKADPDLAEIPVILLSFVGNKSLGFALGASDYLTKPVDGKRLAALLKKYRRDQDGVASNNLTCQILIVEDDVATRKILRRILERQGWAVTEADSGSAALDRLKVARPHLILLDLMLPEMDGFELIGELRKSYSGDPIPIVVITGKDLTPAASQQLNGYVERVLQKRVYSCDALLRQVRSIVNNRFDRRYDSKGKENTNG